MDRQVQKLTTKGRATRQRIVEGAAAEIRARGLAMTTLEDVMARTSTSKSLMSEIGRTTPGAQAPQPN